MVEGMCGTVEDGESCRRACGGYEAGQSRGLGEHLCLGSPTAFPASHTELEKEGAAALRPGESGLLALDWWNGNRSVLVDVDLTGIIAGMTLATTAPEIYRALIEATAFGTRTIVEAFESKECRFYQCAGRLWGTAWKAQSPAHAPGLPPDVTRREISKSRRSRSPAPPWARPCG